MGFIKNIDKKVVLYIIVAFFFSIGVRMIWVYQFGDNPNFIWNGQLMINTNDGYYYAEGARDILAGFHQPNDLSPIQTATSKLTAWITMILPFSLESIILYMSAVLSSFIVAPLILLGKNIKSAEFGLIAALIASIAWSYYNRTMVGYYDTDMLNVVLPMFVLWSLVLALNTKEEKYVLVLSLFMILYSWWYPGSYSLHFAFLGLVALYVLFQYYKYRNSSSEKEDYMYSLVLISFMLFSMVGIDLLLRLFIVIVLFSLFHFRRHLFVRYVYIVVGIATILFFISGGIDPILGQLKGYVFRDEVSLVGSADVGLHFFTVMQTVREAGSIPFELFANRISGHKITFFIAIIGYGYLCYKHRVMLLALPMLGLGFLAYSGGLRFTVYAVPIMALGLAYLIVAISEYFQNKKMQYVFMIAFTALALTPNILHVKQYRVPTVFSSHEVKVLDNLKKKANREDYVVAWWDYGYPIRYYSDVKTLVDGGKHDGSSNFPPSFILTQPQKESAKMARLDVEYTEKAFDDKNNSSKYVSNIEKMIFDYGYKDTNVFLEALKGDIKLPEKTRDIYLYLPFRMTEIYPTIAKFSHLDLMSGKSTNQPFFFKSTNFKDSAEVVNFGNGVSLDKKSAILTVQSNKVPVKTFYEVGIKDDGTTDVIANPLHHNGLVSIVYARSYNTFFIFDNMTLDSTYVQLFLLGKYDKELFEPIDLNPYAKVYKLKI